MVVTLRRYTKHALTSFVTASVTASVGSEGSVGACRNAGGRNVE